MLLEMADSLCRLCTKQQEIIGHPILGCPELEKTEYTQRYNKVASYIHLGICMHYTIEVSAKYYEQDPRNVTENSEVTILWDMPIDTDKEIKANRPDIVVKISRGELVNSLKHLSLQKGPIDKNDQKTLKM